MNPNETPEVSPQIDNFILSLWERITIMSWLPKELNIVEGSIVVDITEKLKLTVEEKSAVGFQVVGESFVWNEDKETPRQFNFTSPELNMIKKTFKELDTNRKVPATKKAHDLYKKFI